jgi:hypothetical protein
VATSAGEIEVKLTLNADDFKKVMGQAQTDLKSSNESMISGIKGFALAAAAALAGLGAFLKSSLDAYGQNQVAVAKLTNALQNQGIASQSLMDHLTGLAEAIQNQTGISHDAIVNAEALATTFGIQGKAMDDVITAATNMSAVLGIDVQQAVMLLGKAFEGHTTMLSRYGIIVNSHIDTQKRFASVMDQVNARFGGAAAAQADTYTGKINIMEGAFNDLKEAIGGLISGPAGSLISFITSTIRSLSDFLKMVNETTSGWHSFALIIGTVVLGSFNFLMQTILGLISALTGLLSKIPLIGTAFLAMQSQIKGVNQAWQDQVKFLNAALQATVSGEAKKQVALVQTKTIAIQEIDAVDKYTADKMAEDVKRKSKQAAEAKTAHEDFVKSFIVTEADMWDEITSLSNSFFSSFGDGVAKIIVEGGDMAEMLQNLWRNLAEQIISYIIQIIAKLLVLMAIEAATGTQGIASSIGGSFQMAAEGGMINEPSLIVGLRSGHKIIAGEAGPEAIVPMGKSANQVAGGMDSGGGGGSGGNITINISGQFLEADQSTWQKLMRDKVLPEIRRFTMSSPTGPFNRRRGVV